MSESHWWEEAEAARSLMYGPADTDESDFERARDVLSDQELGEYLRRRQ